MSFPTYPAYRDSGAKWLGQIPIAWDALPFKRIVKTIESGTSVNAVDEPAADGEFGVLKTSSVYTSRFRTSENKAVLGSESARVTCPLRRDCLIVSRMNTPDLVGASGYVEEAPKNIYLPDRLWQVELKCANPRFFAYWMQSAEYRANVQTACGGTSSSMQNLSQDAFLGVITPIPPLFEQQIIQRFLDDQATKIDALIAEQERLIELLQEKRQTVISLAVTKGLNPDVPMKPSGLEWLGDVPANWDVMQLRRAINFLTDYEANGSFADTKSNVALDEGEPHAWYVRATDLENGRIGCVPGNRFCDRATYEWLAKTALAGGELLLAKRGEIGKVYVMPMHAGPATLAPNLYLVRLNNRLRPAYAWYWFSVDPGNAQLVLANKSTTIGALYKDDVRATPIVVPPVDEQDLIISHLQRETSRLDLLAAEARVAIALMSERRSALISAAVTGQIDVRGLVEREVA